MEKQYVLFILSVFVVFVIQHAMRMRHIVCHLWCAPLYEVFRHYLINGAILEINC